MLLKQHVHVAQGVRLFSRRRPGAETTMLTLTERRIVMLTRNFKYKNAFQRIVCSICHMKHKTKKKRIFFFVQKYYQFSWKDQSKQSWMPGPSRFRKQIRKYLDDLKTQSSLYKRKGDAEIGARIPGGGAKKQ